MDEVREHAFFVGDVVTDLALVYKSRRCLVQTAPDLEAGRQLLSETFPGQGKAPKILLVVAIDSWTAGGFDPLRRLVEPLDHLLGADPRTVLVGEASVSDFGWVRSLLWSHVVDWFPAGLKETLALRRIDRAWQKNSFRRQLLGLGLASGAPIHVATHQRTRLQMAKDLRLERLHSEPLFRAAMKPIDGDASWDSFAEDLYWDLWSSMQDSPEQWAEAFDLGLQQLSALKASGLRSREDRMLLLRFWCALLAERMEGVVDMTRKDLRELEEYVEGVEGDFLKGGDDD